MQNLTKNPALGEREEGTLEGEGGGGGGGLILKWRNTVASVSNTCDPN